MCLTLSACDQVDDPFADAPPPAPIAESPAQREMRSAVEMARDTVEQFIAEVQRPGSPTRMLEVKVMVRDEQPNGIARVEDLVMREIEYRDGRLHGIIDSRPLDVRNVQQGDPYSVAPHEILDWMIVEDGFARGGFTIRATRRQMPPEERRQFDEQLGFRFADEEPSPAP